MSTSSNLKKSVKNAKQFFHERGEKPFFKNFLLS